MINTIDIEKEIEWVPLKGFSNYIISNKGEVRQIRKSSKGVEYSISLKPFVHTGNLICIRIRSSKTTRHNLSLPKLLNQHFSIDYDSCTDIAWELYHSYSVQSSESLSLPGEEWRNCDGFDGYQVSNLGRVKKNFQSYTRSDGFLIINPEKIIKNYDTSRSIIVSLRRLSGEQKIVVLSHVVANAFIPNPDNHPFVVHLDGDRTNNKVNNLLWSATTTGAIYCDPDIVTL